MIYAENTSVPVEKSRAEIESMLNRYGATRFAYMADEARAIICFQVRDKMVKFMLPLPRRDDPKFWTTPTRRNKRTADEAYREWEQACRSRWRSLCLCIKAKLECVQSDITTFEAEFLAHFVMPDGRTLGEMAIPQLEAAAKDGRMPQLLIGNGELTTQ